MTSRRSLLVPALLAALAGALWWSVSRPAPEPQRDDVPAPRAEVDAGRGALLAARPVEEPEPVHAAPARAEGPETDLVERNNLATLELAEGRLGRAIELLEACRAGDPSNDTFRRNLAEALVRRAGEEAEARVLGDAAETLGRALALAPDRADAPALERLRERWRREAEVEEEHWTEGSSLFELSYDTRREDLLHRSQEVLDHLETCYEELATWFGRDPVRVDGRPRLVVVLYRREEFGRLTGLGDWAAGAFDGVVRVPVEDLERERERWRRVLAHELVHAFVHALGGPDVPGWLNEGLAQLLELEDPGPLVAAADRRLGDAFFPLERLQGSLAQWEDAEEIRRAYAQSLLLVARIEREYGAEALRRMVLGVAQGRSAAESFEAWSSVPLSFAAGLVRDRR